MKSLVNGRFVGLCFGGLSFLSPPGFIKAKACWLLLSSSSHPRTCLANLPCPVPQSSFHTVDSRYLGGTSRFHESTTSGRQFQVLLDHIKQLH